MLCNFWLGMLGGLVVYSFTFLLDLAWFNLIDYFPCIWFLSLQIESHQEWVWYFLLDHLTILHYLTCTDGVRVANVLSLVFLMCACHIYLFSHSFVNISLGDLVPKGVCRNSHLLWDVWKEQRIRRFLIYIWQVNIYHLYLQFEVWVFLTVVQHWIVTGQSKAILVYCRIWVSPSPVICLWSMMAKARK